jgi:glycosyltransferase involved in cell wall biosynthesis
MKIGIDARFFGSSGKGLGRYTRRLIEELEKSDTVNQYEIYLYGEGYDEYIPHNPLFQKIQVPYRWYGFGEQLLYPFFLFSRQCDLIHFPHFNVPLLYRRPFVLTLHDLILLRYPTQKASTRNACWYWVKYFFYKKVIASALKRAQTVLVVSLFTAQDLVALYPKVQEKIVVTLEGVEEVCFWQLPQVREEKLQDLLIQAGMSGGRPYALYVGNAYPHKNLTLFLSLAEASPETDIVLVGRRDYFYDQFQESVCRHEIKNIFFAGGVSDQELALLYGGALLYVFPSLYEGFGLPPLEAFVYGTAVLSSDRGSLPEVLGQGACFADPRDEKEFLRLYQELLHSPSKRTILQEKGVAELTRFSWKKMAEQTKDVYTSKV